MRVRRSCRKLLVDLAVRRCAGMQPAARWARWCLQRGNKGRKKRGGLIGLSALSLVGKNARQRPMYCTTNRDWPRSQRTVAQLEVSG